MPIATKISYFTLSIASIIIYIVRVAFYYLVPSLVDPMYFPAYSPDIFNLIQKY